jgi:hypothetical protein
MASIINFSLDLTKIPKDKIKVVKKKDGSEGKYLDLTLTLNNELDNYGNNGPVVVSQSMEERQSKADKVYLGNAKIAWTDGQNVGSAPKSNKSVDNKPTEEVLPF